jgi:hypothetical protein
VDELDIRFARDASEINPAQAVLSTFHPSILYWVVQWDFYIETACGKVGFAIFTEMMMAAATQCARFKNGNPA